MKNEQLRLETIADLADERNKKALVEVTLIPRFEALLEDMNRENLSMRGELEIGDKERLTQVFSASEVGQKNGRSLCGKYVMGCGRYLYYSYTGQKGVKNFPPKVRRILDTGSAVHVQLQLYALECAKREQFEAEVEAAASPDDNLWGLSAHMDIKIRIANPKYRVRFGVELKSIADDGFKATTRIQDHHLTQCTIYQVLFDLPAILVLYYNKNNSLMAEFIHVFDKHRWKAIQDKLEMVRMASLVGEPPPYEVSYECTRCKFRTICKPPKKTTARDTRKLFVASTGEEK